MVTEIVMPKLSDTMEEGKILKWLKGIGDPVDAGEVVAEVETDKADMELEALDSGILAEIRVPEGGSAPVGAVIALLAEEAEWPGKEKIAKAAETPITKRPEEGTPPGRVLASPLAKRMAEERGIDVARVSGSGPGGRVIKKDVEVYASRVGEGAEKGAVPLPERGRRIELSRMRKTTAKRMAESKREIPHFYVTVEVDMSEAVRLKKAFEATEKLDTDITFTHMIIKAVALALERHPHLNASYAEGSMEIREEINLGIAAAVEEGLIVPVLKNCHRLSLPEIAARAGELLERVRKGRPKPEDLSGGTFTITNMGMLDIEHFAAVINPPQGAILAVGAIKERPVVRSGHVVAAHTMMVTLSCDHRIIDGVAAGRFLEELKRWLENPATLLLS